MPADNRALGRKVHIYAESDPTEVLGGLVLTNGVTNANFYSMIEVFLFIGGDYFLRHEDGTDVQRNELALRPGNFYIVTNDPIIFSEEYCLVRAASRTRTKSFRDAVRERDSRCVITGQEAVNAEFGIWTGFQAAHIFPLAYEGHWKEHDYGRWITIPPATESAGSINSVQNADNYKIVCFIRDGRGIAGRYLDQQFLDDPRRPADELLGWHFKQAVLANMRGAGEPYFELDFPPGSDIVGEIVGGPKAAQRMGYELFTRLAGVT